MIRFDEKNKIMTNSFNKIHLKKGEKSKKDI